MRKYGVDSWIDDKYRVCAELGSGGMSSVKLAFDPDLNRKVAIKLLHQWGIDSQSFQRFEREAKALSGLLHKNIVRVYKLGFLDDNTPYLVMEYVEGESLRDLLKRSRNLPCNQAVGIGLQICEALEFAHKHQIIHRDLKPENVIVCENGSLVKVLDFGLCRIAATGEGASQRTITETGTLLGTAHYMSPELCMGQKCDLRTDIYSFGSVLFEMITGNVPFASANPADVFFMQVNKPVPKLLELSPGSKLPEELQDIILKCMQKNPDKRYQDFAGVKQGLAEIAAMKSTAKFIPCKQGDKGKTRNVRIKAVVVFLPLFLLTFAICAVAFGTDTGNGMLAVQVQNTFSSSTAIDILTDSVERLLRWGRYSAAKAIVESSLSSNAYNTWPLNERERLLKKYVEEYKSAEDKDYAFNLTLRLLGILLDSLRRSIVDKSQLSPEETELLSTIPKQLLQSAKSLKQWRVITTTIERHNPFQGKIILTPHVWVIVLRAEALLHQEKVLLVEDQLHGLVSACQSAAESLQLRQAEEEKTLCLHYSNEALRVCLQRGFLEQEAQVRIFLGTYFLRSGNIQLARKECQRTIALSEKVPLSPAYTKYMESLKAGCDAGDFKKYLQYREEHHERRAPESSLARSFLPNQD